MEIRRVDTYEDARFSKRVLCQHGAFLVDGKPCEVEITGRDSAAVRCPAPEAIDALIDEFRFYAGHISRFTDESGAVLREFPAVERFPAEIGSIQPSQFYADEQKLAAVKEFIYLPGDIVIPLIEYEGRYVSLDGHTRLYAARQLGFGHVYGFLTECDPFVLKFVEEAQRRGIHSVFDMELLSHADYCIRWHKFCDDFFERNS